MRAGAATPLTAQPGDPRKGFPVTMGKRRAAALSAHRTPAQACHLGRDPALVDEDQPRRVELGLALEPFYAALEDIFAALLGRVARLFLYVRPRLRRKAHTVLS